MKLGIIQMCSVSDVAANIAKASGLVERCVGEDGARWVCLPEHWNWAGGSTGDKVANADDVPGGRAYGAAQALAAKHNIWLHAGSLLERARGMDGKPLGKVHNTTVVFDPGGREVAIYRKIHLFDIDLPTGERWRESAAYSPGDRAVAINTPVGRLGMTICYDLRFPRLFESLRDSGATIIAVPAAFTVPTGKAHWHSLLRARAVDNGCFIVAPAQTGHHADGRETFGHSLVIDPWGDVLLDMGEEPGLAVVEIDLAKVQEIRQRLPLASHQRPFLSAQK